MSADVQLDHMYIRFGDFTAVDDANLLIEEGEFFSFLGPSGCGKTTILRAVSGFLEPTQGEVRIGGKNMRGIGPNKRPTALIFQNLMIRWLRIAQRKLAYRKAREKREAEKKLEENVPESAQLSLDEPEVDLATIDQQSRELIYSAVGLGILIGLWVVWSPILPALRFIGDFPLWQSSTIVNGEEILRSITTGDLALAGLTRKPRSRSQSIDAQWPSKAGPRST